MPPAPGPARTDHLRAIPMFSGVPDDALDRVAEAMTEVELRAGQTIIEAGAHGAGLFIVEAGAVAVELPGRDPVELGPGQFVGEVALLSSKGIHVARVRTVAPTTVLALARADFERLLMDEPRIAVAMLRTMADRLVDNLS